KLRLSQTKPLAEFPRTRIAGYRRSNHRLLASSSKKATSSDRSRFVASQISCRCDAGAPQRRRWQNNPDLCNSERDYVVKSCLLVERRINIRLALRGFALTWPLRSDLGRVVARTGSCPTQRTKAHSIELILPACGLLIMVVPLSNGWTKIGVAVREKLR